MISPDRPTVLFVHGSWHQPSHFARVRAVFEEAGNPTSCPRHASFDAHPPIGLTEDAQVIRDELTRLIDQEGKNVIVVAHSYGGVVTTQAVDEGFAKSKRLEAAKKGGVLHLLFMCAFMLPNNVSLVGAFGGQVPPFFVIDDEERVEVNDPAKLFYNDLPVHEQKHWVSELRKCPMVTQTLPISQAAYLYHPVTYLFCENDAALPVEVQRMMVKNVSDATGIKIREEICEASHSPFLSMPEEILRIVQKFDGDTK